MIEKYRRIILFVILMMGFTLRFYTAASIPPVYDEMDDLPSAEKISLNINSLNLPLVDTRRESAPIAFKYIARVGWYVFGDSLLGARLPFVILGTLIILLVYFLTASVLGVRVGLLAALLLSISHYDIGTSRVANINPPQVFFFVLSLLIFYKAITTSNKKLMLLNGLIMGMGFWVKESVSFLMPIYFIFLLVCDNYKHWLRNKYLWISFVIAFCVMLPLILLNLDSEVPRFSHVRSEAAIGVSMNAIGFYLGEIILLIMKLFPEMFNHVVSSLDMEYPIVNFVFGFLILLAVSTSIKKKDPFIRLLMVAFMFNFIVFSLLRRGNIINSFCSIGSFDWSILGFIPGVILTANMLYGFIERNKFYGKLLLSILLVFMFVRALILVSYPLPGYFPVKDYFLEKQLRWAQALQRGDYESDIYLPEGNVELAKETFERIYKVSDKHLEYKKQAVLGIAQIASQEEKY